MLLAVPAQAQQVNLYWASGAGLATWQPTSAANPLPVTGTITATFGPSSASTAGVAPSATAALASSLILKGSAGNLYALEVSADATLAAATWYVMIYNATSLPGNGAITPAKCFTVPAGSYTFAAGWGAIPAYFSTGITVGVSTTGCFTQTASVHAFISGEVQ